MQSISVRTDFFFFWITELFLQLDDSQSRCKFCNRKIVCLVIKSVGTFSVLMLVTTITKGSSLLQCWHRIVGRAQDAVTSRTASFLGVIYCEDRGITNVWNAREWSTVDTTPRSRKAWPFTFFRMTWGRPKAQQIIHLTPCSLILRRLPRTTNSYFSCNSLNLKFWFNNFVYMWSGIAQSV